MTGVQTCALPIYGILKRWHEKGLHTLAEVKAENAREQSKPKKNTNDGGNAWMKEYLNQ